MSTKLEKTKAFLEELQGIRAKYLEEAPPAISRHMRQFGRDEKEPDPFHPTSFLYIRSYEGDLGNRPFSGITFWHSPDISLWPMEGGVSYTTTLEAGKSYNIRCQLHNSGDLMISYPKVEFFLCEPSLGFNTAFATQLGLTQMNGLLLAGGQGYAELTYQVPFSESGHKCLFARTFSFSPLDKPDNLNVLDPRLQRHVAQKNLNFVAQASPYSFQLVHLPNAQVEIQFRTLTQQEVFELRHPFVSDFKIRGKVNQGMFRNFSVDPKKSAHEVQLKWGRSGLRVYTSGEGPDLRQQAQVLKTMEESVTSMNIGRGNPSLHKEIAKAYEELNRHAVKTDFECRIPDFGLGKGEAAGMDISAVNLLNGKPLGGITLIVTG